MSKSLMASSVDSKPSRINNGWLGSASNSSRMPSMLDLPRISMFGKRFGSEPNSLFSMMANAGSSVFKLCNTLEVPMLLNSAVEYVVAEPVKLSFLRVKIPVTTTSSISVASSASTTLISVRVPTTSSFAFMPINENTSVYSPSGRDSVYLPSASVAVPIVVPLMTTATPGSALPASSFTTPLTFRSSTCCCCAIGRTTTVLSSKRNSTSTSRKTRSSSFSTASFLAFTWNVPTFSKFR